jgi:endonuclease-3
MTTRERFKRAIEYFKIQYPNVKTELNYSNNYELIVSVILSAQCTDKRVNMITPALFRAFPNPESLAKAKVHEIYEKIKSCTYPNNKANNLLKMAKVLVNKYNSILPEDPEEMQNLPGIGRKSAHVLASAIYNKSVLAVDTHVFRVSARIGLTKDAKNPLDCEIQLVKFLTPDITAIFSHWLIMHGRYICIARKPKCEVCGLRDVCLYFSKRKLE